MGLEIELNHDSVNKLEKFIATSKYKELAQNTMSFNRKLNEERKMRIPYVDSQTGVAQRHYDMMRRLEDRMPGRRADQILSYPQRKWTKKRYQYLHHFMTPKHLRYEQTPIGEPIAGEHLPFAAEEVGAQPNGKDGWEYFDDDTYAMQEPIGSEPESDSDFEYEGGRSRKGKAKKGGPGRKSVGRSSKKKGFTEVEERSTERSSRSARRGGGPPPPHHQHPLPPQPAFQPPPQQHTHHPQQQQQQQPQRAESSGYCDFCLGDSVQNKKTGAPEQLIACSICGRAGHPTCLQFTKNMMVSVRKYPWQCIECKSCTLCGTSENDDKLLFCDDCDRGYHMYCLVPPMKVAPEGSWSCSICVDTFHRK